VGGLEAQVSGWAKKTQSKKKIYIREKRKGGSKVVNTSPNNLGKNRREVDFPKVKEPVVWGKPSIIWPGARRRQRGKCQASYAAGSQKNIRSRLSDIAKCLVPN